MREMHHLVWYVFASGNVLLVLFNINVLVSYSASAHKWLAFFVSSLLIGWMVFRIRLEVKVPYFMPKIKWWEADPAAQFSLAVNLTGEGISMGAECLDISKKGCFLKVKDRLQIDDSINLELKLSGEILSIPGIVVESSEASVTRPRGIGVKFVSMPKQKKKKLGMLVQKEMDAFKKSSEVQLKKETLDQKSV